MNSTRPITVISMAYNKATTIERTYKSLRAQTSLDFEWLIVNDGSKDNVKEVVSTFQEDLFPIRFIDKENEGPARTWNRAVQEAQGELLFRVDPDDYVTEDAIEQIISHMHLVYEGNNTCGLVFLTKFEDGVNVGFHPYDKDTLSNFVDYRLIGKATGDRAEVITKAAALEFPWPFIEGEKFILESSFWSPMGLKYNAYYINKAIYIREYTLNSITGASNTTYINNPKGAMFCDRILLDTYKRKPLRYVLSRMCKLSINYYHYGLFSDISIKEIVKRWPWWGTLIGILPGSILYWLDKHYPSKYKVIIKFIKRHTTKDNFVNLVVKDKPNC